MDSHSATVLGREDLTTGAFEVLGKVKNSGAEGNSNENAAHNQEIAATHKYFKEIAHLMPNIDQIHITGTGQIQEQFIKYLADTAQYKNVDSSESTSNKMTDEEAIAYFTNRFQ